MLQLQLINSISDFLEILPFLKILIQQILIIIDVLLYTFVIELYNIVDLSFLFNKVQINHILFILNILDLVHKIHSVSIYKWIWSCTMYIQITTVLFFPSKRTVALLVPKIEYLLHIVLLTLALEIHYSHVLHINCNIPALLIILTSIFKRLIRR